MRRIELSKVLRQKNPALARWIPRFAVHSLEGLICAKKLNLILSRYEDRDPMGFIDGTIADIGTSYKLVGVENIPAQAKLLFAANHPLGGIDGLILARSINDIKPGVRLIVNDVLLEVEPLKEIFVGVNKYGAQRGDLSSKLDTLYQSDAPIINFPAGLCSRLVDGDIVDLKWHKNFISRSIATQRVIVPTYVDARNSMFFYRLAKWRKRLGINFNIELILLPRQMFFQRDRVVTIYFGSPITPDNTKSASQWCDIIREQCYALKQQK